MSQKPIAKILVLGGPTHYAQPLPDAGPTDFTPGRPVVIYTVADLEATKRLSCSDQFRVRIFPRIEDVPAASNVEEAPVVKSKKPR